MSIVATGLSSSSSTRNVTAPLGRAKATCPVFDWPGLSVRMLNWLLSEAPMVIMWLSPLASVTAVTRPAASHVKRRRPNRASLIATTRPETMLGDTAVMVHPDDPRYRDYVQSYLDIAGRRGITPEAARSLGMPSGMATQRIVLPQAFRNMVPLLLTQAVRDGLRYGHAERLVLIGQSYGADMVHVGFAGLPADLKKRVALVVLVAAIARLVTPWTSAPGAQK